MDAASIYLLILAVISGILAYLAFILFKTKPAPAYQYGGLLMICAIFWAVGYALEILSGHGLPH